jgi:hypothetical protein
VFKAGWFKITKLKTPNNAEAIKTRQRSQILSFFTLIFDMLDFQSRNNILLSPYFKIILFCPKG